MYSPSYNPTPGGGSANIAALLHQSNKGFTSFTTKEEHGKRIDQVVNGLKAPVKNPPGKTYTHTKTEKSEPDIKEEPEPSSNVKPEKLFEDNIDNRDKGVAYKVLLAGLEAIKGPFKKLDKEPASIEEKVYKEFHVTFGNVSKLNKKIRDLVKELSSESKGLFNNPKFDIFTFFFRYHRLFTPEVSEDIIDNYIPLLAQRKHSQPDTPEWAEKRSLTALNSQDFDLFRVYLRTYSRLFNEKIIPYLKDSKRIKISPEKILNIKNLINRKIGLEPQEKPRRTFRGILSGEYNASETNKPYQKSLNEKLSEEQELYLRNENYAKDPRQIRGYFHLSRELRKISESIKTVLEKYEIDSRTAFGFDIYFIKETKLPSIKTIQDKGYFKRIRK